MNNLLPTTQSLLEDLKKSRDMVIISYDSLVSLMATLEEELDKESKKARKEAEKDIKKGNLTPFESIIREK